jgi:hypothetical protein
MMKTQELTTLGSTLVILGIMFGSDRLIGYSFIGAGMLLSIITIIKAKKEGRGKSLAGRGS